MRAKLIIIALMLLASASHAELLATNGKNELRLFATACKSAPVLAEVGPTLGIRMHAARALVDGDTFEACWIVYQGTVFVIYDDGDRSSFPLSAFHEQPGA